MVHVVLMQGTRECCGSFARVILDARRNTSNLLVDAREVFSQRKEISHADGFRLMSGDKISTSQVLLNYDNCNTNKLGGCHVE